MSKQNKEKKEIVLDKKVHQLSPGLAVEVKKSRMEPEYDLSAMISQIAQHHSNIASLQEGIETEKLKIENLKEVIQNLGK